MMEYLFKRFTKQSSSGSKEKGKKKKRKLSDKQLYDFTLKLNEERRRRKRLYHEHEKRLAHKMRLRSKTKQKSKAITNIITAIATKTATQSTDKNMLLKLCKMKVMEAKKDSNTDKDVVEVEKVPQSKKVVEKEIISSSSPKKTISPTSPVTPSTSISPTPKSTTNVENNVLQKVPIQRLNVTQRISEVNPPIEQKKIETLSTFPVVEEKKSETPPVREDKNNIIKKPLKEVMIKDKTSKSLSLKSPGKKSKKKFDSIEESLIGGLTVSKTMDISHPYAVLNCREDVTKSKLKYLYKENKNNNWDIYDSTGTPFWLQQMDSDTTDDTAPEIMPLDLAALIDVEQGKIELPEYLEEPNDLNPFHPIRVLINRNPKYFEYKKICLTTLRSMAALHLKDSPIKVVDKTAEETSNLPCVEITDVREYVTYPRWTPKQTTKNKYTGIVWPERSTTQVSSLEKRETNISTE
uniref:Bromo domain-containing protein n=1 Tax=Parastrongyloides trichosuri TaxID=131310 RepID=A0A0N5A1K5_PARTI